ncbi:hypothetical protein [Argonema antarcticum]|uniref:hypothetical protein n=1 Tax=Argonema antarcticum TaxID=2942763 RepID=UPI0020112FF8|nr:hypothetical protein [Argonema antarcticum]MCL1470011.1 hypothetical protein [Argonema antarcticum A004/B2]
MANPKRAAELIGKHFAEITTEQFIANLKKHCPEVFEDEIADSEISQSEINQSKNELDKKAATA